MDDKNTAVEGYKKAVEKLSSIDINAIIFLLLFLIIIVLISIGLGNLSKKLKAKKHYEDFIKYAKEKGLSDKQISILWNYSQKMGRDPFLALEFKSPFERVIDYYIKENPDFDEELIKDMREKLGFDYIPYFVPLTSTKDIDLFQGGTLKTEDGRSYSVSLYDKDELYMYWVITDKNIPRLSPEDNIKISFVRRSDAAYTIESKVEEVINENGKIIIKIPHTFELLRVQRREYPRVDVDFDILLGKVIKQENQEVLIWNEAKMVDISPSGARVCIKIEDKERLNIKVGDKVIITFTLLGRDIQEEAEVMNITEKQKSICYGLKFTEIKESQQKHIFEFVRKEQKRLMDMYKKQS